MYIVYDWRAVTEIFLLATAIYFFARWLSTDTVRPLLPVFYGYCALVSFAHVLELHVLADLMLHYAPVCVVILLFAHETTLQKQFIVSKHITQPKDTSGAWLEYVFRACLHAASNNKSVTCVIQKHDQLSSILTCALPMHAPIQRELIDILVQSDACDTTRMIIIDYTGSLIGLNGKLDREIDTDLLYTADSTDAVQQQAVYLAHKTDALIFRMSPQDHTIDIMCNKKVVQKLSTADALQIIKKYLFTAGHVYTPATTKGSHAPIAQAYEKQPHA